MTTPRLPVTSDRVERYLEVAAACAGSPHITAEGARSYWRRRILDSSELATKVGEAKAAFLGRLETVISDHAINGVEEPVYQMGRLCWSCPPLRPPTDVACCC